MSDPITSDGRCNCVYKGNMGSHADDCAIRKPVLPAVAVHAELRKANKHAVFVRIKVMDSRGESYYFDAASFHYDLRPWEKPA